MVGAMKKVLKNVHKSSISKWFDCIIANAIAKHIKRYIKTIIVCRKGLLKAKKTGIRRLAAIKPIIPNGGIGRKNDVTYFIPSIG
ncbi:hypothetical protein GCM10009118_08850 [Wandonia haliotis]|uniref:Uncharacterized protein n=1 Tax=Wandonia haliotis TaxID=574963 RepID=A0ABN1MMG6_9FLAO